MQGYVHGESRVMVCTGNFKVPFRNRDFDNMEIRVMRETDGPQVYSVICESLDEYFLPETITYFRMQWPSGQIVASDFAGRIVGYLAGARLPNGRASVHLFAVSSGYRGRGIGSQLLARFRQSAAMEGYAEIQLEVKESNAAAFRFYSKRGFVPAERLESFYNDGSAGIRMVGSAGYGPFQPVS